MLFAAALLLAIFVLDEPWTWIAVALGGLLEAVESWLYIRWSRRRRPHVGVEALIGRRAIATTDCRPAGQVRVAGELWNARCDHGVAAGAEVVVREVQGLTLVVDPG